MSRTLVVVGATGYTGRLVVARLHQQGVPFVATGRDLERVRSVLEFTGGSGISMRRVDLGEPTDLEWVAQPGHVVLSCAGPYSLYGRGLAEAVARHGAAYVDITGEEAFVAFVQQELDERAREAGALMLPSCAFESLPATMLASALCRAGEEYLEIASYYRVAGHAMSPGTQLTMKLASRWPTTRLLDGRFVAASPGSYTRELDFPFLPETPVAVFAPYPEIRLWPRVHHTRGAASFLAVRRGEAALLTARTVGAEQVGPGSGVRRERSVDEIVTRHLVARRRGPTPEERSRQTFDLVVVVTSKDGAREAARLEGRDPYGLTAAISVWVCERLIRQDVGSRNAVGVLSPAEIFAPDEFLEMLRAHDPGIALTRITLGPAAA